MEKCGEVLLSHNSKFIFVCAYCNEEFIEVLSFGKHVQKIHLKLNKNEVKDSKEKSNLFVINPLKLTNGMNKPLISTISQDKINLNIDNKENDSEIIEIRNKFNNVAVEKISIQNDIDSNERLSIISKKSEQNIGGQIYVCNQCPAVFKWKKNLTRHKKVHSLNHNTNKDISSSLNNPKCDHCNREFRRKADLHLHVRSQSCIKNHICSYCSKRLKSKAKLISHIRNHTGERPFKCTYCTKSFTTNVYLGIHVRRHLGEKRYSCKICEKRFVHRTEVNIHMKTHTGEKPFQCDECGQKFPTSSALTVHKKRHTNIRNYKCEICSKTFLDSYQLRTHLVVHSDERPFKCDTCSATFPRKRALQSHIKIHSDIKEYICTICDKTFAQNSGLYSHMKSHGVRLGQTPKTEYFNPICT